MKVLLIVPTFRYKREYPAFLSVSDFPTGYAYLATALKKAGHEVIGLNLNNITGYQSAYEMIYDRIYQALKECKPDLIGIGGLCIDFAFIRDAIGIIRHLSNIPIVLGGGIVTHDAEFIFNLLKPDWCITGEAERAMVALADTDLQNIKQGVICGEDADINSLPFPDYEPFGIKDMLDKYSIATRMLYSYSRPYPRTMVIVTARGCPFSCTFCVHHKNRRYRARSIENIMAEIKETYEWYHFNVLIINDELFAINKVRMREFNLAILEGKKKYDWNFDWLFQTHASAKLDKEVLELAKQAGCYCFSYGLESGSPTILRSMNKKTKVSQIVEAISLANQTGLGFSGNLIYGDPAETEETITGSLEFYFRYCRAAHIVIMPIMPYPGSKLFADLVEKGQIPDKVKYYESINDVMYNMTSIPTTDFNHWNYLLQFINESWRWVKAAELISCEPDSESSSVLGDVSLHKITAKCPYCGTEIFYRRILYAVDKDNVGIGVGCTYCNKKIKILIPKTCLN